MYVSAHVCKVSDRPCCSVKVLWPDMRSKRLRTKFDESIWSRCSLYLAAIQACEFTMKLLQILIGQLFGVSFVCQSEVAYNALNDIVEGEGACIN